MVGGKAAAEAGAVTHGAVRCSAWLGVAVEFMDACHVAIPYRLVSSHASFGVCREFIIASQSRGLTHPRFTSSPGTTVWRHPAFTFSPSLSFSVPVPSPPVSTGRRFGSFLSPMHSADSRFWPGFVWAVCPNAATPNHALQRTAPHVTAPASTATFPPTMQVPRRTPLSLSLESLGVAPVTS
jgi:hypothetical protein